MQDIRGGQQAVTVVRAGLDVVAQRAEFLNAGPNGGPAYTEVLRGSLPDTEPAAALRKALRIWTSMLMMTRARNRGRCPPRAQSGSGRRPNEVDAGLSDGANGIEVYTAAGLGGDLAGAVPDGLAQLVEVHVVEQDEVGACGQGLVHLFEGVGLDFHLEWRIRGPRAPHGGVDGVGPFVPQGGQVVVFDENHVKKPQAMIAPAAASHSVFFQTPPGAF